MIPGNAQGGGLTEKAAQEMGLRAGTPVGVSLIDAYAGTLGLLACRVHPQFPVDERLGIFKSFQLQAHFNLKICNF